ncbi:peptide deformylase [Salinifilum aidingensis]
MPVRPIRTFGDPVLRERTAPVTVFDDRLRSVITDLLDTVDQPGRAGLAAPQIGVGVRAFSYNVDEQFGYVVNPVIAELSAEEQDDEEGCLSLPNLSFPTRRAQRAVVRGVDLNDEPVTVEGEGLMARCLQHEVDHLDGMVYLQRLDAGTRREAYRQVRGQDWFWQPA